MFLKTYKLNSKKQRNICFLDYFYVWCFRSTL